MFTIFAVTMKKTGLFICALLACVSAEARELTSFSANDGEPSSAFVRLGAGAYANAVGFSGTGTTGTINAFSMNVVSLSNITNNIGLSTALSFGLDYHIGRRGYVGVEFGGVARFANITGNASYANIVGTGLTSKDMDAFGGQSISGFGTSNVAIFARAKFGAVFSPGNTFVVPYVLFGYHGGFFGVANGKGDISSSYSYVHGAEAGLGIQVKKRDSDISFFAEASLPMYLKLGVESGTKTMNEVVLMPQMMVGIQIGGFTK